MVTKVSTKADFEKKLGESEGKLVVVDFFAEWCGPCKMISPKLEAMTGEFSDVVFLKVDVDEADEVAQAQGISAMPTFQFFKNGKKIAEVVGANEQKLREAIKANK